ncbi:Uncharacterized protein OBRU01_13858 [Operophtera brumata]|uniref:HTH psq-type domain-containing protein n=1 Tax=Operophtera brumata TaxID=104452 RepID=A0A0L7L7U2_OPEBR|nr:Uncharacterized protein OBRU01_13858 [Operophtera brumata]
MIVITETYKIPRNNVRKTNIASYPRENLLESVRAVKTGKLSGYEASKHYGIPRPTIINRVYDRKNLKSNTLGRATILSREVEDLVKNLRDMEKHRFGLTRKEILETVGLYVSENDIKNPFKNDVPGVDWFLSFKKRHNLSIKKPQPVEYARKQAYSPYIIYPYFDLLEQTLTELKLLDRPSHIWNVDETSFLKDPSKSKVVGIKGFTSTRTIVSPGKDHTTVLLGCNALGEKTPPVIVFKGKNVWDEWTTDDGYPGTVYAATNFPQNTSKEYSSDRYSFNQLSYESTRSVNIRKRTFQILENRIIRFEDLLLLRIKAVTSYKTKIQRMATGAEVITRDDVLINLEKNEQEKKSQTKLQEKAKAEQKIKKTTYRKLNTTQNKEKKI